MGAHYEEKIFLLAGHIAFAVYTALGAGNLSMWIAAVSKSVCCIRAELFRS